MLCNNRDASRFNAIFYGSIYNSSVEKIRYLLPAMCDGQSLSFRYKSGDLLVCNAANYVAVVFRYKVLETGIQIASNPVAGAIGWVAGCVLGRQREFLSNITKSCLDNAGDCLGIIDGACSNFDSHSQRICIAISVIKVHSSVARANSQGRSSLLNLKRRTEYTLPEIELLTAERR
jgi:hypothetical protein|tara:strand:- start:17648 stop:18175 length:528 start_codon:yes stop_codon:yes gene_type:complete